MLDTQYLWLILMVAAAIIEAVTAQIVSILVAAGALAGLITSFFISNLFAQILVFIVVLALTALIFSIPAVKSSIAVNITRTNADKFIGKEGIVTQDIDNTVGTGQVSIDGNIWSARSHDGIKIEKGSRIIAKKISGVKLIVKVLKERDS